jgi:hypothetical protein
VLVCSIDASMVNGRHGSPGVEAVPPQGDDKSVRDRR